MVAVGCADGEPASNFGGFGGEGGRGGFVGGSGGDGGAGGELAFGQCRTDEDCNTPGVYCVPAEYRGFFDLSEGEIGVCRIGTWNDAIIFFREVSVIDIEQWDGEHLQYEVLAGTYWVDEAITFSEGEEPIFGGYWRDLPIIRPDGTGWHFFFGMLYHFKIRVGEYTVACALLVDPLGLVSGGEVIDGDHLSGTVLCPGEPMGLRLLVTYEILDWPL